MPLTQLFGSRFCGAPIPERSPGLASNALVLQIRSCRHDGIAVGPRCGAGVLPCPRSDVANKSPKVLLRHMLPGPCFQRHFVSCQLAVFSLLGIVFSLILRHSLSLLLQLMRVVPELRTSFQSLITQFSGILLASSYASWSNFSSILAPSVVAHPPFTVSLSWSLSKNQWLSKC